MSDPRIYTSGPVDLWAVVGPGVGAFLGHGRQAPVFEQVEYFRDVKNDLSGGQGGPPADKIRLGCDVRLAVTLERYDYALVKQLTCRQNPSGGVPGKENFGDRGSLMVAQGKTFALLMRWPLSYTATMQGLPNGYRILYAILLGPDRVTSGIDQPVDFALNAYGFSAMTATGSPSNPYTWQAYDNDLTSLGATPPLN